MTSSVRPYETPPELDDGIHQQRDHAVLCVVHKAPTWRRDALCERCLLGDLLKDIEAMS